MYRNNNYASEQLLANRRVNQALGDFVNEAFKDEFNVYGASMDLLLGQLAESILYGLERAFCFEQNDKPTHKMVTNNSQPLVEAFQRYAQFVSTHHIEELTTVPPYQINYVTEEQYNEVVAGLRTKYSELELLEEKDPVIKAWNLARQNHLGALQRVGAFYYLSSQVDSRMPMIDKDALETECLKASRYLFQHVSDFLATEMKFAIILGGKALEITQARVVANSFGPDMAVIQYLQRDERYPSYYPSHEASDLREKVAEYVSKKS